MRLVIQRVSRAEVSVPDCAPVTIGRGLLVLVGVARGDRSQDAEHLAHKTAHLRIFEDESGKMNRSALDTGAEALVVSQFTLLGDSRKGHRPSFMGAAAPEEAQARVRAYVDALERAGLGTRQGFFGKHMQVSLVNDGPVTIILENRAAAEPAADGAGRSPVAPSGGHGELRRHGGA